MKLDIRHLMTPETYEGVIDAMGGGKLNPARAGALKALTEAVPPGAREHIIAYSDALIDEMAHREQVAVHLGVRVGVGIGALLVRFPERDSTELATLATDVVTTLLSGGGAGAIPLVEAILEAIKRVDLEGMPTR